MKNNMRYPKVLILTTFLMIVSSCYRRDYKQVIDIENIYAWCIVPFDSVKRSPAERITMLKNLGIKKYAYDWREEDLLTMSEELKLAKQNDIPVIAVWLWIDANLDSIGKLNPLNEKALKIIEDVGYKGEIWLSFHPNYFEGLPDSLAVKKGVEMISYLNDIINNENCKIALYNHQNWFGQPANQVKIIQAMPNADLGIVYNFHHAHHQIEAFPEIVEIMMPYLWHVNVSGLRKNGPKILTAGAGDHEMDMVKLLKQHGYKGDFGILGHTESVDMQAVLKANLKGLYIKTD